MNQLLIKRSVDYFGITYNIREAGFILPDGRLLDLSGKHECGSYARVNDRNVCIIGRDYLAGGRVTDHREVNQFMDDPVDNAYCGHLIQFMREAQAVRIDRQAGLIDIAAPLTRSQQSILLQYFNEYSYVEYSDPHTGYPIRSFTPDNHLEFVQAIQASNSIFAEVNHEQH